MMMFKCRWEGIMLTEEWEDQATIIYNNACNLINEWNGERWEEAIFKGAEHNEIHSTNVLDYHAAHIVWADGNFETHHINWCLSEIDEVNSEKGYPEEIISILRESLNNLLLLPPYEDCVDYVEF